MSLFFFNFSKSFNKRVNTFSSCLNLFDSDILSSPEDKIFAIFWVFWLIKFQINISLGKEPLIVNLLNLNLGLLYFSPNFAGEFNLNH